MSISELGSIGEFISGLAVLITLIYLAIQVRQTRKVVMAQAYHSRSEALQELSMRVAESESLSRIQGKLHGSGWPQDTTCFAELSETEQAQYRAYLSAHVHRMSNLTHQYREGLLTDAYYETGILGTIVTWMRMWEGAQLRLPIPVALREVHQEALALEAGTKR